MTYSGVFTRTRGIVLISALALAGAFAVSRSAEAVPSYDGVWSVVIVTKQGLCDGSYRYPVRITKGSLFNAGNATVNITGKVDKHGAVVVNVSAGDKTAVGTGHLSGKAGGGSWSGGKGPPRRVWQAE